MPCPRVLITESIHPVGIERLAAAADVIYLPDRPGETIDQHLPHVDGIIVRTARLDAPRLQRATRLRVIGKHGVGVDNIDLATARSQNLAIVFTPGANAQAVAEHALTLMLMLARKIQTGSRLLRQGQFELARRSVVPVDLQGKTLGLVGCGQVGQRLATIGRLGLSMSVLAFDPYLAPEQAADLGVELVADLPTLLERADVVSIHAPLTPETRGLIDRAALARMKPTAYLINCARGGLVDEAALLEALRSGQLAGAGLDVFVEEPTPTDHPLLQLENVVATPHLAGGSQDALRRMAETVATDVLRVLRGEQPAYPYR